MLISRTCTITRGSEFILLGEEQRVKAFYFEYGAVSRSRVVMIFGKDRKAVGFGDLKENKNKRLDYHTGKGVSQGVRC